MSKLLLEIYKHSSELHKIHGPQDPWPEISDEELDRIFEGLPEDFEANSREEGADGVKNGPG